VNDLSLAPTSLLVFVVELVLSDPDRDSVATYLSTTYIGCEEIKQLCFVSDARLRALKLIPASIRRQTTKFASFLRFFVIAINDPLKCQADFFGTQ